jgi:dienelactone hydrolase
MRWVLGWTAAMAAAIGTTGPATAQIPPPTPAQLAAMRADNAAYDRMPDTRGTGPFAAARFAGSGLPAHLVYRPRNLRALGGRKLGVLVWGNGGCSDDAASARLHLLEIASHGYVVIAPGRALSGPGVPPRPEQPPGPLGVKTTAADVSAGIDWALAENARPGSPLFGRIDPAQVAVSGHSCGGLEALQIAADPRIRAVIVHNSGIFADGSNPIPGITIDKAALTRLHTPVLYVMGGPTDIAWANGSDDFDRIAAVPAVLASLDVGHGGTFHAANGGRAAAIDVAWLAWQLRGDAAAARWFTGKDCRLCGDRAWTLRRKGLDAQ